MPLVILGTKFNIELTLFWCNFHLSSECRGTGVLRCQEMSQFLSLMRTDGRRFVHIGFIYMYV